MENNPGLALVTGASSALGAAIAIHLAGKGYELVLHYRNGQEKVERLHSLIIEQGGKAIIFQADLSVEKELDSMFGEFSNYKNPLQVLVNNAACLIEHPIFLLKQSEVNDTILLNQVASYGCLQRAARIMSRHNLGFIVNIGSLSMNLPFPGQAAYAMSKASLLGLTKSAALELGRFGITVNMVIPGAIDGGMLPGSLRNKKNHRKIPVGAIPQPGDIAACVGFLCSHSSKFITGQSIIIDGGLSLTSAFTFDNGN